MSRVPWLRRGLFGPPAETSTSSREALNAFRDALRRELDRSRRYERRFAVLAADLAGPLSAADRARLRKSVTAALRSSDVFAIAERRMYVLLPEADGRAAQQAFERIIERERRPVDELSIAIATFPDDGVTMGSILALLRRVDLARRRRMSPIAGSMPSASAIHVNRDERAG